MRPKRKTHFVCRDCGAVAAKWQGRCGSCGAWNTLEEELIPARNQPTKSLGDVPLAQPRPLSELGTVENVRRIVGIHELDRVLGGGVVPGSVLLLGGEPGIGKSTLLLQAAKAFGERWGPVLYVSGEESTEQIRLRAERLDCMTPHTLVLAETDLDRILAQIEAIEPALIIIDSVQTMALGSIDATPGSVPQVRETANALQRIAKLRGIPIILVGHVTKEGGLAGPKVLEHLVDVVLHFEGDRHTQYRLLRGIKNRFGNTSELGIFEMQKAGLVPIPDPSQALLAERPRNTPGSSVTAGREGSRTLLLEVQALVGPSPFGGTPRRQVSGLDYNRVSIIIAVLERRLSLNLQSQDVYLNVAGGLRVDEPATDLSIAVAIASSLRNRAVGDQTVFFGEIGLAGEVRAVSQAGPRLEEAVRLGFQRAIIPQGNIKDTAGVTGIEIIGVSTVGQALEAALAAGETPVTDAVF